MATSPLCEEIERLREAVEEVCGLDPFTISSPDSLIVLERLPARLEYIKTKAIGEFDASGEWALDGAKSAVAWLDTRCHLPKPGAQRLVRRARALAHLPVASAAFAKGEIGAAHVDALVKE